MAEGETLGLIGPNGAGKTTVFNMIMAELKPTSGEIWFKGENITRVPTYERVKRGIARTYQVPQPFAEMSVGANIRVGMAPDDIWKLVSEGADHGGRGGHRPTASASPTSRSTCCRANSPWATCAGWRWHATSPSRPRCCSSTRSSPALRCARSPRFPSLLVEKKRRDGLTYIIVSHDLRALAPLGGPGHRDVLRRGHRGGQFR